MMPEIIRLGPKFQNDFASVDGWKKTQAREIYLGPAFLGNQLITDYPAK
jgi:hypothetical protein